MDPPLAEPDAQRPALSARFGGGAGGRSGIALGAVGGVRYVCAVVCGGRRTVAPALFLGGGEGEQVLLGRAGWLEVGKGGRACAVAPLTLALSP